MSGNSSHSTTNRETAGTVSEMNMANNLWINQLPLDVCVIQMLLCSVKSVKNSVSLSKKINRFICSEENSGLEFLCH